MIDYSRPHLSRWDIDGGVRHFESQSGYYVKESKQIITINSQGIRVPNDKKDYQYSVKKPSDTFRILIFGDSMAEGLQVTFYERFSHIMETELNNCAYKPKEKIEIINFALSGTGQARQFEMQQGFAKKYETDIILAVAHSNDPRNNYNKLEPGIFYPYWTLENDSLIIDTSFRSNKIFLKKLKYSNLRMKIVNQSRVLQLLTQGYEVYLKNKRIKNQKKYFKELHGESVPYWISKDWEEAWAIFLAGFEMWSDKLAKDNIPLYVSSTFFYDYFIPNNYWRENFGDKKKNFDDVMKFESNKGGYKYLPVWSYMGKRPSEIRKYFSIHSHETRSILTGKRVKEVGEDFNENEYVKNSTGHYNYIGHREWGLKMASELCKVWKEK
tara:strand:+ start:905 stop:2053 length:1149 start_codon:yes stop_codon:yes gene_type:complete